jgi:voltage-gated potassium channel
MPEATTTARSRFDDLPRRERRRLVLRAVARTLATVALVATIYFLMPLDHAMNAATVTELVLGVLALSAIIAWQIWRITRSEHPGIRAVEALAFTVPLYIPLFATAYFLMDHAQASTFVQPLSRIDSMYFSATVFTTVGFGDITAKGEAARVMVTFQMMLDLVILGLVARLVINAIKIGQQRHAA